MIKYSLISFALFLSLPSAFAAKRALIYNGPGSCTEGCYQAAYQVALKAGFDPVYVGAEALDRSASAKDKLKLFKDAAIWIQPGGKSKTAMTTITPELKTAIEEFVSQGGGYVGFCAGAFSSTELVGTTTTPGFNFMPGKTTLYPEAYDADIIPVTWNGKLRQIYWEGGPYLSELPPGKAEVVATYPDGSVAAAKSVFGKGKIFVTGLHPEAPQYWRDYYELSDADGLDQDLAVEMIQWAAQAN